VTDPKKDLIERFERSTVQAQAVIGAKKALAGRTFYAMVVVVEADSEDAAFEAVGTQMPDETQFVGPPWKIVGIRETFRDDDDAEFDTLHCIDQHPGR
jgi:hypothetical protein